MADILSQEEIDTLLDALEEVEDEVTLTPLENLEIAIEQLESRLSIDNKIIGTTVKVELDALRNFIYDVRGIINDYEDSNKLDSNTYYKIEKKLKENLPDTITGITGYKSEILETKLLKTNMIKSIKGYVVIVEIDDKKIECLLSKELAKNIKRGMLGNELLDKGLDEEDELDSEDLLDTLKEFVSCWIGDSKTELENDGILDKDRIKYTIIEEVKSITASNHHLYNVKINNIDNDLYMKYE